MYFTIKLINIPRETNPNDISNIYTISIVLWLGRKKWLLEKSINLRTSTALNIANEEKKKNTNQSPWEMRRK